MLDYSLFIMEIVVMTLERLEIQLGMTLAAFAHLIFT
jgi:hypothetical protein